MADDYPEGLGGGTLWLGYPGLNGTLEVAGDIDSFYYATYTPPASFRLTNATFEIAQLVLRDQNHNIVATYYGPAAGAYLNLQPDEMLGYYVSVTGFNALGQPTTGTYTITAADPIDDHPDAPPSTSPIVLDGAAATGAIDHFEDWDSFRIDGADGNPITVTLASAEFARVIIYATNQHGITVATYNGLTAGGASFVAPPDATHIQIIGFDAAGNYDTGAYSIAITSIPDDHGDTVATATPMSIGGASVTAVNEGGDVDVFSFYAVEGQHYIFDWLAVPPNTTASYSMFDQYGRSLNWMNSIASTSHHHEFTAAYTGMHYIQLQPGVGTSFQIVEAVDDYSDTLPTNGVLTIDGPSVTARHDWAGDFDVFAVDIAEAGAYRFEISPLSLFWIHELLALYDENGDLVTYRVVIVPNEGLTVHVDAPGTYYLGVESALNGYVNHDDLYTITAYSMTDDYGQTIATTGEIVIDGPATTGAINYNEDIDWLRFEVTGDHVLEFTFATTGFWAHDFQIMNEDGVLFTWVDDDSIFAGGDTSYFLSLSAGTYYFALGDPMGGQSFIGQGTYSVGITIVPGQSPLPDPLTLGTPVEGELFYSEGDHDALVFTAQAGQTIRFDAESDGYWWRMSLYHYDTNGVFTWDVLETLRYDAAFGFTFLETGTYYLNFNGTQPTTVSSDDLGGYTIFTTIINDDSGPDNTIDLTIGTPQTAIVNYENDVDLFAFTVEAGQTVEYNVTHGSDISGLHAGFAGINFDISVTPNGYAHTFQTAGTYYISVAGAYWEEVGGTYTVTTNILADDYRSDTATTGSTAINGAAFVGQFEFEADHDWIAVDLVAGERYVFTIAGSQIPSEYLNGSIDIFDENGVDVGGTGFTVGATTEIVFTASYSGTHYLDLWSQMSGCSSAYTLTANTFTPPLIETIDPGLPALPDDSFDHVHVGADNVINLYFAEAAMAFGDIVSDGWFAEEIDAVMAVLATFEAYLNVDFQITDFLPNADLAFTTFDDPGFTSIFQRADWDVPIPIIGFSHSSPLWTPAALAPGGLGAAYVLNAMGFALGLAFPHEPEGDSTGMNGVTSSASTGAFDLNQGVYTIMSFNDGWTTSPYGTSPSDGYGWQATPMALDLAVLQSIYGANTSANAGATTHTLGGVNAAGAAWRAIWDTSGVDTLAYAGAGNATLDLRAATLNYEVGGAGFLSFVEGIHGGYSIAHGVLIEHATGGAGADTLIGNQAANILTGNDGDDTFVGGAGADTFAGGAGSDTANYAGALLGITANLQTGTATDGYGYSDALNSVENVTGTAFNDTLLGSTVSNILSGGAGADHINGGAGADIMSGGAGNDIFFVDNAGDVVVENAAEGTDTIRATAGIAALAANVENLIIEGGVVTGNGNALNNTITGNAANNSINGGAGADVMSGGLGNDTYFIDNAGDAVVESSGQGTDIIFSTIDIAALATNVENLTISGTALSATGNALNNTIAGNAQNNTLNGGAGEDTLIGGIGNDFYFVNSAGDVVTENLGAGTDTILAFINITTLAANVENVTLAVPATSATGNSLNNILTGNHLNNTLVGGLGDDQLNGGVGADTMSGGGGDDAYLVENAGDVTIELSGEGNNDIVYAFISLTSLANNIERATITGGGNLNLTGNTLANRLNGNAGNNALTGLDGADTMQGLDGADVLTGGAGLDILTGGTGADTFVFNAISESGVTGATRDVINDFTQGADLIQLGGIDAITGGGDNAFNFIGTAAFSGIAGQLRHNQIDNSSGVDYTIISMDVDGDGVADSQITLVGLVTLTVSDFGL